MPSLSVTLAFAGASLLLLLIPGPAVLYIVNRSVSDGRQAGLSAVAGLSLGNLVWYDTNNNGQVDTGEYGVSGVKVDLYQDTNSDGSYTPGVDAFISTTTTSASGYYSFTQLLPSSTLDTRYLVVIAGTNFVPGGALALAQNSTGSVGSSNTTNSQDNGVDGTLNPFGLGGYVASRAITLTLGAQPVDDGDASTSNPLTASTGVADNLAQPSNTNWTLDFAGSLGS